MSVVSRKSQSDFRKLLLNATINVGPVSYVPRKELAIIAHATCNPVMEVAANALRDELVNGWYDTYHLCDGLTQYGYLSRYHSTLLVFCSNSFMLWRRRAQQCSLVSNVNTKEWKAGISRIVSKTVDTVVTPSVFTAA